MFPPNPQSYLIMFPTITPVGVTAVAVGSTVRKRPKSAKGILVLFLSLSMVATFGVPLFGVEPIAKYLPSGLTAQSVKNASLGTSDSSWNFAFTRVAPLLLKLGVMKKSVRLTCIVLAKLTFISVSFFFGREGMPIIGTL